jgi:mono/diheme cytochrome c family protein
MNGTVLPLALCALVPVAAGCRAQKMARGPGEVQSADPRYMPEEPQRAGDPQAGYHALVNNGYVSCGIPWSLYSQAFGAAPASARLDGRDGDNAELSYEYTAFTAASGVELVSANCLTCHAGYLNGQLVVGLGAHDRDFTGDPSMAANAAGALISDPAGKAEWAKWAERVRTIAPYSRMRTVGPNPADNFTAVLFAHHDPTSLAWLADPILELPPAEPPPVDVPPWWRMRKKHAMFYVGAGRGDHARIMMTASTLCTDTVDEARRIDAYFNDVRAYIYSLEPPKWPFPVDPALADRGRPIYEATCARCHGTYGDQPTYPNLVIPLDDVGTDPVLAQGNEFAQRYAAWYRESFYGQTARFEPQAGYVAPPLDGVWATAPFLHNGSVPTLALVLDSSQRPTVWKRTFDSRDYDPAALGWRFSAIDHGQADEPDPQRRKLLYDTTLPGYGAGGHTYGDALSADDRAAVLEYLKTL